MKNNPLLPLLNTPEKLESLYREQPKNFTLWLKSALSNDPQNKVLLTWKARIDYKQSPPSKLPIDPTSSLPSLEYLALLFLIPFVGYHILPFSYLTPPIASYLIGLATLLPVALFWLAVNKDYGTYRNGVFLSLILLSAGIITFAQWIDYQSTYVLSFLHVPLLLASIVGLAFIQKKKSLSANLVSFLLYAGESSIYTVLIFVGSLAILLLFIALGLLTADYLPPLAMSVPLIVSYFYEKKLKNHALIASNLTPFFTVVVLIFTTLLLLIFPFSIGIMNVDRDILIGLNWLLLIVWTLSVFSLIEITRKNSSPFFLKITLSLMAVTLVLNTVILAYMASRLFDYGMSPNRLIIIGCNLLIFIHLSLLLYTSIKKPQKRLNAITHFLPVYPLWALFVVFVLPFLFH